MFAFVPILRLHSITTLTVVTKHSGHANRAEFRQLIKHFALAFLPLYHI